MALMGHHTRLLWSRFNIMKTKFTPEDLTLNVCGMVDISFRRSMAMYYLVFKSC